LKQFGKRNLREIEKWKAPEMDKPIEAIIQDLNQNEKSHSTRLNSLEAANYLNQELLQQIDGLRTDNEQLREENCRLRLEISTVSRLPSIDSGYPLTHGSLHQLPEAESQTIDDIDSFYVGEEPDLCEMDQSNYGHSIYSGQSRISQHNVTSGQIAKYIRTKGTKLPSLSCFIFHIFGAVWNRLGARSTLPTKD